MQFLHSPACDICGEPVRLETCKTNDRGQAVHELCYVESVALIAQSACVVSTQSAAFEAEWKRLFQA